jgi:hypothetical protein
MQSNVAIIFRLSYFAVKIFSSSPAESELIRRVSVSIFLRKSTLIHRVTLSLSSFIVAVTFTLNSSWYPYKTRTVHEVDALVTMII